MTAQEMKDMVRTRYPALSTILALLVAAGAAAKYLAVQESRITVLESQMTQLLSALPDLQRTSQESAMKLAGIVVRLDVIQQQLDRSKDGPR